MNRLSRVTNSLHALSVHANRPAGAAGLAGKFRERRCGMQIKPGLRRHFAYSFQPTGVIVVAMTQDNGIQFLQINLQPAGI